MCLDVSWTTRSSHIFISGTLQNFEIIRSRPIVDWVVGVHTLWGKDNISNIPLRAAKWRLNNWLSWWGHCESPLTCHYLWDAGTTLSHFLILTPNFGPWYVLEVQSLMPVQAFCCETKTWAPDQILSVALSSGSVLVIWIWNCKKLAKSYHLL